MDQGNEKYPYKGKGERLTPEAIDSSVQSILQELTTSLSEKADLRDAFNQAKDKNPDNPMGVRFDISKNNIDFSVRVGRDAKVVEITQSGKFKDLYPQDGYHYSSDDVVGNSPHVLQVRLQEGLIMSIEDYSQATPASGVEINTQTSLNEAQKALRLLTT